MLHHAGGPPGRSLRLPSRLLITPPISASSIHPVPPSYRSALTATLRRLRRAAQPPAAPHPFVPRRREYARHYGGTITGPRMCHTKWETISKLTAPRDLCMVRSSKLLGRVLLILHGCLVHDLIKKGCVGDDDDECLRFTITVENPVGSGDISRKPGACACSLI